MSQTSAVLAGEPLRSKRWRNYAPFPVELEECACPACGARERATLLGCDQFGFPVGTAECRGCGLVYTHPRPSEAWLRHFYEKHFWTLSLGRREGVDARFLERLRIERWAAARFYRAAPYLACARSVLDVGCGTGHFLDQVRRHYPAIHAVGIEPDAALVKYAREELGVSVHRGFFQSFGGNETFDAIALFHVIEHLFNLREAAEFVARRLNPGGVVLVEVPNVCGAWKSVHMIHLAHLQIFSARTLGNFLCAAGFRVLETAELENDLDESNLFAAAQLAGPPLVAPWAWDAAESERVRARFTRLNPSRALLVLRAWMRMAYFAARP